MQSKWKIMSAMLALVLILGENLSATSRIEMTSFIFSFDIFALRHRAMFVLSEPTKNVPHN